MVARNRWPIWTMRASEAIFAFVILGCIWTDSALNYWECLMLLVGFIAMCEVVLGMGRTNDRLLRVNAVQRQFINKLIESGRGESGRY